MLTLFVVVGQLFITTDTSLAAAAQALKRSQLLADIRTSTTFRKPPTACGMPIFVADDSLDPHMAIRIGPEAARHLTMRIVKPPMCGEFDQRIEPIKRPTIRFGPEKPPTFSPAPPR
jgi:3-deoxy-D-arabino-heptulosonate 7-phosphate (DAHP) synthase